MARTSARDELETARRLEPGLQKLTVWFAMLELESGNIPEAIGHARTAMSQAGLDPQAHIQIAQVFRQAGDFDSMRVAARRAVELTPESMRERVSALILQMLGPTALEEPDDLDDEELTDEELDEEWDEDDDFELAAASSWAVRLAWAPPPAPPRVEPLAPPCWATTSAPAHRPGCPAAPARSSSAAAACGWTSRRGQSRTGLRATRGPVSSAKYSR